MVMLFPTIIYIFPSVFYVQVIDFWRVHNNHGFDRGSKRKDRNCHGRRFRWVGHEISFPQIPSNKTLCFYIQTLTTFEGIGLEFVRLLLKNGCNVVIGDLQLNPNAQKLVESTSGPSKVVFKKTDVTNWVELTDLFTFTEKEFGTPDIVCPAAGIFEPKWSNFWNDTEEQGYKTVQVNIEHPVKATRLAIRSFLKANKAGIVAHVSSIGGQCTRLGVPIYCATKAFINHFVRAFAELDSKERIKVLAVAPGFV